MGMDQPPPPTPPSAGGPQPPDLADMGKKLQAAKGPDRMLLIAGLLFLVATFLPWWRVRVVGFPLGSQNAWHGGLGVLAALLGLATLVFAVASITGMLKPNPSFGLLSFVLGGGTLLFTLIRFLFRPGPGNPFPGVIKVTRGIGVWGALILAIVMAVAAYQKYQASNA